MGHREFKDRLYPQFARIGRALASEKRLELLDLLTQSPRNVEDLAAQTGTTVANISQHLGILREARLVETERQGTRIYYRLAGDDVLRLWLTLRGVAEERLAEVDALARRYMGRDGAEEAVSRGRLQELMDVQEACLLDVRPAIEYEHGHLEGALSIPIDELADRLAELPRSRLVVTYCRGEYCLFADEAAEILRDNGFRVACLEGGWPEWLNEGRPVAAVAK